MIQTRVIVFVPQGKSCVAKMGLGWKKYELCQLSPPSPQEVLAT
ncbi:MAG: hypothetical protein V7K92_04995 [Nostoc sp.]